MRFTLDYGQKLFSETLDRLLSEAEVPSAARAWATGSHDAGLSLWRSLADAGLFALAVPESAGGTGAEGAEGAGSLAVELVTAFRVLGKHGVPGPYVETIAVAELLSRLPVSVADAATRLPLIAEGALVCSLALPPHVRYALDADIAGVTLTVDPGGPLRSATVGKAHTSLDPARRLFEVGPGDTLRTGTGASAAAGAAFDLGALLCAAQLSGIGDRLLSVTVEYAKTRRQFGRPIGEFQAVKHHLADAYVALEYARPLLYGGALSYATPDFPRDVSAAKAACSEAAYFAARIALQVHGAIGYTDEYDPTLLIRKARALRSAWGSPATHKSRVLASLAVQEVRQSGPGT